MSPVLPSIYGIDPALYIELPAIFVGGVSGGVHAARRGFDFVGVLALTIATGIGGGIVRDVLLGVGPPVALTHGRYLVAVAAAAIVAFVFAHAVTRIRGVLAMIDALSLGFFGVAGTDRALAVGLPLPGVVLLGVLAAVGGSVVRDVLSNEIPV